MQLAHDHTHQRPSPIRAYIHSATVSLYAAWHLYLLSFSIFFLSLFFFFSPWCRSSLSLCVLFQMFISPGHRNYMHSPRHSAIAERYSLEAIGCAWCQFSFFSFLLSVMLSPCSFFSSSLKTAAAANSSFSGGKRKPKQMSLFWCFSFAMKQANKLARIKAEKWIENRLLCARVFVFFVICSREREMRETTSLSLSAHIWIYSRP